MSESGAAAYDGALVIKRKRSLPDAKELILEAACSEEQEFSVITLKPKEFRITSIDAGEKLTLNVVQRAGQAVGGVIVGAAALTFIEIEMMGIGIAIILVTLFMPKESDAILKFLVQLMLKSKKEKLRPIDRESLCLPEALGSFEASFEEYGSDLTYSINKAGELKIVASLPEQDDLEVVLGENNDQRFLELENE